MPTFTDDITVPSTRTTTRDGYLTASAVLARAGIQQYRFDELGIKDSKHQPDDMVNVFRSREALEQAVESFEKQPITLDHTWTHAGNWRRNAVGDVHDIAMDGDHMWGTLVLRDARAIEKVHGGRIQLSNGYNAQVIPRSGTYQGEPYEYEQTDLVGNHVAVVEDLRVGYFFPGLATGTVIDKGSHGFLHWMVKFQIPEPRREHRRKAGPMVPSRRVEGHRNFGQTEGLIAAR